MKTLTAIALLATLRNNDIAMIEDASKTVVGFAEIHDDAIVITDLGNEFVDAFPATIRGAISIISEIIDANGDIYAAIRSVHEVTTC